MKFVFMTYLSLDMRYQFGLSVRVICIKDQLEVFRGFCGFSVTLIQIYILLNYYFTLSHHSRNQTKCEPESGKCRQVQSGYFQNKAIK